MKSIEELGRINKIEGNVFISFDLNELAHCDEVACGALKLDQPPYLLHTLLDHSTNVVTMRYSVPEDFVDVASCESELQIEEILTLYEKILEMLDTCEDWFLKPGGLCFELSHVYMNTKHDTLKVLYIPEQEAEVEAQNIKYLMISLLEKCQETSGGSIQLQLYKYFYKPKFNIEEFRAMLLHFKESLKETEKVEKEKIKASEVHVGKMNTQVEVATILEEKEIEVPLKPMEEREEDGASRSYYRPKIYPSQLSQEEVEEMVKSIYSGNGSSSVIESDSKQLESVEHSQEGVDSLKNEPSAEENTQESSNYVSKRKNLFDNVFSTPKTPSSKPRSSSQERVAALKSISVHTRYDLPKLIEIRLVNQKFTIGRATRTGEATGADYEFGAEITPISRLHARIEVKEGAYYLKDLGSSNGTFLNGKKIEPQKPYLIEEGDKIAFAIAYSKNSIEYAFVE